MTAFGTTQRVERAATIVFVVLIVGVLFLQAGSLYIFPQPDSARWWGDETGQMLELRTELQTGVARIPAGLGSSVAVTNGLVRGNSWVAAFFYGVPALVFSNMSDLVSIGRTVTFVLSLLLLFAMYAFLRAMHVPRFLAFFALLLFITTRSFFFGSHAARLDIAAGLALVLLDWYLAARYERLKKLQWMPSFRWYFFYGVVIVLLATLSIHLVTLVGMLTLFMLWRFRAYKNFSAIFAFLGGVIAMAALLVSIYALSGAPVSIFGPSIGTNQFQSVADGLPILRPFSRSVQVANIVERIHGSLSECPAFLFLIIAALLVRILIRQRDSISSREQWVSGTALTVAIAWLLFESPALYYYVQVLPLFIIALIVTISGRHVNFAIVIGLLFVSVVLAFFSVRDSIHAATLSHSIAHDNYNALSTALLIIEQDPSVVNQPIVLAQNPAIARLEHDAHVQLMSAHLVSFPISNAMIAEVLNQYRVNYILLYASHDGSTYSADYAALRPVADSEGVVLLRTTGTLLDVHRDYFSPVKDASSSKDTLILYKLPTIVR